MPVVVGSSFDSPGISSAALDSLQRKLRVDRSRCRPDRTGAVHDHGMVIGMASKKVTVTLNEVQLRRIRGMVEAGTAPSVSGFVQHAVSVALDDVAGWGALLAEALQETGGPLTGEERAWADEILNAGTSGNRPAA